MLDRIPGRKQLEQRLQELVDAGTVVSGVQKAGSCYFYFKTLPTDNTPKLYVRDGNSEWH